MFKFFKKKEPKPNPVNYDGVIAQANNSIPSKERAEAAHKLSLENHNNKEEALYQQAALEHGPYINQVFRNAIIGWGVKDHVRVEVESIFRNNRHWGVDRYLKENIFPHILKEGYYAEWGSYYGGKDKVIYWVNIYLEKPKENK